MYINTKEQAIITQAQQTLTLTKMSSSEKTSSPPSYVAAVHQLADAVYPAPKPRNGNHATIYGDENESKQTGSNNHNQTRGNRNCVIQSPDRSPAQSPNRSPDRAIKMSSRAWMRTALVLIIMLGIWEMQNVISGRL